MAMNSSSCSVLPISIHADNDFTSTMRQAPGFVPRCPSWEADDLFCPSWEHDFHLLENLYRLNCEVNNHYDHGGPSDRYDSCDPVDLLPSDPFGMELSTTFTAAIAGWIEDLGASPGEYEVEGDELVTGYYCNGVLASSSEPQLSFGGDFDGWVEEGLLGSSRSVEVVEDFLSSRGAEADHSGGDGSVPHEGLFFSLGYLGIKDLLSVEMVCRSLYSAVQNDTLLWRCIHIDSPLSERITDDALLRLTQRAQGSLQCLSLVGCSIITDDGLKRVLECNPRLKKLGVPRCVRLSIDGLINNLKAFKSSGMPGIKCLKLGRLFSVSPDQFEELMILVDGDELQQTKPHMPRFYHICLSSPLACDEERAIDVEMCPGCQKFKLVYDCPSESCQGKGPAHCRGCEACIPRCVQCGRCINDCEYVETFCLEYLCSDCWKHAPESPEKN